MNYRGYIIKPADRSPALVKVVTEGQGGKIPNVLTGLFTHPADVKQKIDDYLDNQKDNTNGKTTAKGRD